MSCGCCFLQWYSSRALVSWHVHQSDLHSHIWDGYEKNLLLMSVLCRLTYTTQKVLTNNWKLTHQKEWSFWIIWNIRPYSWLVIYQFGYQVQMSLAYTYIWWDISWWKLKFWSINSGWATRGFMFRLSGNWSNTFPHPTYGRLLGNSESEFHKYEYISICYDYIILYNMIKYYKILNKLLYYMILYIILFNILFKIIYYIIYYIICLNYIKFYFILFYMIYIIY